MAKKKREIRECDEIGATSSLLSSDLREQLGLDEEGEREDAQHDAEAGRDAIGKIEAGTAAPVEISQREKGEESDQAPAGPDGRILF